MYTNFRTWRTAVFNATYWKRLVRVLFLALPLFYVLNADVMHRNMGAFFLGSVDPEYFYLYNGAIIGGGTLSVEYTAHPGTPLMILTGISARAISFFQPGSYVQDVVDYPEKYIHSASLLLMILVGTVLFILGVKTWKYTGSVAAGLLVQLALPGSASLMHISGRLIPEALMILPMLIIVLLILRHIHHRDQPASSRWELSAFAVVTGFGIACKLSFIPMIIIPMILIHAETRTKLKYLLYTFVSFAVFAYPVIFNFGDFWDWISGLFAHSGKYGTGDSGIINLAEVPGNFRRLFDNDRPFFYILALSIAVALGFRLLRRGNATTEDSAMVRAIAALNATVVLAVAFTLKHFEVYYFIPYYVFKIPLLLLSAMMVLRLMKKSRPARLALSGLAGLAALFLVYGQVVKASVINKNYQDRTEELQRRSIEFNRIYDPASPLILAGHYSGAPFIEFAHYNGFQMSFNRKGFFKDVLKKKFDRAYLYVSWSDQFYFWNDLVDFTDILDQSDGTVFVYAGTGKQAELDIIDERIRASSANWEFKREIVCRDEKTGEQLIRYTMISHHKDL